EKLREIYETGHGSVRLRAKYEYDKAENCIDILEIPYTTSIEVILKKIDELRKEGKIKDIIDSRDEIDLNGFKLTIDLKKGTDPDLLMRKLFKLTTLEDDFDCNFNVLINGTPQLLGVKGILEEWIRFRLECLKRETVFELQKLKDKLHLLLGLAAILLDIDLAIKIIRDTKNDKDVVPNLMAGFDIDEVQANYVADIKLRALNHENITARTEEIAQLQINIAELEDRLSDENKQKDIIVEQLKEIKKKYGKDRKTEIIMPNEIIEYNEEDYIETYDATLYLTERGYFKKIKATSLRMNDDQTLVDGDRITYTFDSDNTEELYFFTDKGNAYRAKVSDIEACKASSQGEFISTKLKCENGERVVGMICLKDVDAANGNVIYVYSNGKALRVPFEGFKTKAYRKKLTNVSATTQELIGVYYESEPFDISLVSSENRALIVNTGDIAIKKTRTSEGNAVMTLKAKKYLTGVKTVPADFRNSKRYRKSIPSSGVALDDADATFLK
ncbi:MAG: topoisomerase IV, partial [Clostridia bacterium]|nr:topoisomerase IV [Clostridia bacterium]